MAVVCDRRTEEPQRSVESSRSWLRVEVGFGFEIAECRIRDVDLLNRRIVPFEFEVASSAPEQRLRVAGDRAVWPGAAEYRNVCTGADVLDGVCGTLVLFLGAVATASVHVLNQP